MPITGIDLPFPAPLSRLGVSEPLYVPMELAALTRGVRLLRTDPAGVTVPLASEARFLEVDREDIDCEVVGREDGAGGCGNELILTVLRIVLSGREDPPRAELVRRLGTEGVEEAC